ncbi:MAG: hypothetical protein ABI832_14460 [bacterium]
MRGAAIVLVLALSAPAQAADPSVTCSVEMARREAIVVSDYAEQHPPWTWWVGVDGKSLGPWPVIDIKRRMLNGELPGDVWVFGSQATAWVLASQSQDFVPLPNLAPLAPAEIDQTLPQLLSGCWVSDPVSEAAGDQTVWMLMLFDSGVFFPSRGVTTLATGKEGFWFTRSSNARWGISGQTQSRFTLSLPDINFLDPQDDFPAELLDRNQLRLQMPGLGDVTFRRM